MASITIFTLSKPNSTITHKPLSSHITNNTLLTHGAQNHRNLLRRGRRLTVVAVTEGSAGKSEQEDQPIPSWAKPDSEEPPPWAKNEAQQSSSATFELPFYVYLLASAITAISAIGSVFEYVNQKPVFGVLESDSVFYAPLLGFFAFTGIPTSGYLWFKSVQTANKEAEEQDRRDGYP